MPDAVHLASGKVREIYALDDERLLLVASDRISTFDVVLPTPIPDKGCVLTGLSAFWFARTREIVPNHLLRLRRGREVGRGAGDSRCCPWRSSCAATSPARGGGTIDGPVGSAATSLPAGLRESERLPAPIVTPATKASSGHDENISEDERGRVVRRGALRGGARGRARPLRVRIEHAESRGIIVADTKFEFGVDRDGVLRLGDEALTPDSSRFWPVPGYVPGRPQPSFDKQFVRDWCETTDWDKTSPGPELPDDVVDGTRSRYVEAFERLTGIAFDAYLADPELVL